MDNGPAVTRPGVLKLAAVAAGAAGGMVSAPGAWAQAPKRGDVSRPAYYPCGPSVSAVAAWAPCVKNFGPNIGHDMGGRIMAAWLDE